MADTAQQQKKKEQGDLASTILFLDSRNSFAFIGSSPAIIDPMDHASASNEPVEEAEAAPLSKEPVESSGMIPDVAEDAPTFTMMAPVPPPLSALTAAQPPREFAKNDPNYDIEWARRRPIVVQDNDSEEYKQWKDTGYYAEHFKDGHELGDIEDALKNDTELRASWIEASKKVYEMQHGKPVPSGWNDEEILEEGLDYIREFNNVLVGTWWTNGGMLEIADKVEAATDEQKKAFGFLMDTLDRADNLTAGGTIELAQDMLSDWTTVIGVGSLGSGALATQGAKEATKFTIKQAIKEALKQGTKEAVQVGAKTTAQKVWNSQVGRVATLGGIEGAIYGGGADYLYQDTMISLERQESYSLAQGAMSTAIGGTFGIVLGGGATYAGQKIAGRLSRKHKEAATPEADTAATPDADAAAKVDAPEADANTAKADAVDTATTTKADAPEANASKADEPKVEEAKTSATPGVQKPKIRPLTPEQRQARAERKAAQAEAEAQATTSGAKPQNAAVDGNATTAAARGMTKLKEGESWKDWYTATPERYDWYKAADPHEVKFYKKQLKAGKEMPEPQIAMQTSGAQAQPQGPQQGTVQGETAPRGAAKVADEQPTSTAEADTAQQAQDAGSRTQDSSNTAQAADEVTPEAEPNGGGPADANGGGAGTRAGAGNTQAATPPKANNTENLIPSPKRSWMHTAVHWFPVTRMGAWLPGSVNPADHLPQELNFNRYVNSYINTVDDMFLGKSAQAGTGNKGKTSEGIGQSTKNIIGQNKTSHDLDVLFVDLDKELKAIASRVNSGGNDSLTKDQAKQEAIDAVKAFTDDPTNKAILQKFNDSFSGITAEMRLESQLAEKIELLKFGKQKDSDVVPDAGKLADEAQKLIEDYELATGRTFNGAKERVEFIRNGAQWSSGYLKSGKNQYFYLQGHQANAMYLDAQRIQTTVQALLDDNFAEGAYTQALTDGLQHAEKKVQDSAFTNTIDLLVNQTRGARMRRDNRDASQNHFWWVPGGRKGTTDLIEINRKRDILKMGYDNPYERTYHEALPGGQQANTEWSIMDVEDMDPSDSDQAEKLLGISDRAYETGNEHLFLEAFKRLNQKSIIKDEEGKIVGQRELVEAFLSKLNGMRALRKAAGPHYEHYEKSIGLVNDATHSPEEYAQREVHSMYANISYRPHHARKFVGKDQKMSKPGDMFTRQYIYKSLEAYGYSMLFGGRVKRVQDDKSKMLYPVWKWKDMGLPEDAGFWRKLDAKLMRVPFSYNIATYPIKLGAVVTKGLTTNRFAKESTKNAVIFGGGAMLAEELVLETWLPLPENTIFTDEEGNLEILGFRPDFGSRFANATVIMPVDVMLTPMRFLLDGYDWAIEKAIGKENDGFFGTGLQSGYLSMYQALPFTESIFDRGYSVEGAFIELTGDRGAPRAENNTVTGQEVAEIVDVIGDLQVNGQAVREDPQLVEELSTYMQRTGLAPTQANVNAAIQQLASPQDDQENPDTEADKALKAKEEALKKKEESLKAKEEALKNKSNPYAPGKGPDASKDWLAAGGDMFGDTFSSAFNWIGGDKPGSTMHNFGTFLSGGLGAIGGFIGDLHSGRVKDGEKWLAGGVGLLAFLIGTPMITKMLKIQNVPILPLVIGALIFGFSGKLAHSVFTGQGDSEGEGDKDGDSDGSASRERKTPIKKALKTDHNGSNTNGWREIYAVDEDHDGEYAVQMVTDNGKTFADWEILRANDITVPGAAEKAKTDGRWLPAELLKNMHGLESKKDWELPVNDPRIPAGEVFYLRPKGETGYDHIIGMELRAQ